jgi:anti-sigma-K factor RskA
MSTEVDEKAQEKADEIAADAYGVGPLSNSRQENIPPEQQQYQDLWGRVQKEGDPKALVSLLAEDSQFIDAVLNGRPLNKK